MDVYKHTDVKVGYIKRTSINKVNTTISRQFITLNQFFKIYESVLLQSREDNRTVSAVPVRYFRVSIF